VCQHHLLHSAWGGWLRPKHGLLFWCQLRSREVLLRTWRPGSMRVMAAVTRMQAALAPHAVFLFFPRDAWATRIAAAT
jgi:hypothetical protein